MSSKKHSSQTNSQKNKGQSDPQPKNGGQQGSGKDQTGSQN